MARHAVHSLRHAVRMSRQHVEHPRLGEAAIARACKHVLALVAQRPLHLELHADSVTIDGHQVQQHEPLEVPFGALHAAGIGELILQPEVSSDSLRTLLQLLAGAATNDPGGRQLIAGLRQAALLGVELYAATVHEPLPRGEASTGWWPLAGADPQFAPLQARIERDRDANLPSLAARHLFSVLEHDREAETGASHLQPLLVAMLQRGDAGSVAFLLEAAQANPGVPAQIALELRAPVLSAWLGPWLDQQLGRANVAELQSLTSLGIQLGDEALQHFFARATSLAIDLPPGLADLQTG